MMVCRKCLCLIIPAGKGQQLSSLKQKGFSREANVFRDVFCLVLEQQGMARLCGWVRLGEQGWVLLCSFQAWPISVANPTFQNNLGFVPLFSWLIRNPTHRHK